MLNSQSTTTQSICDNFSTFQRHAAWLHRGAAWRMAWTPNAGATHALKRSLYLSASVPTFKLPADWLTGRNCYFGVHGLSRPRKPGQASRNEDVSAVNCLFAEFDGVDEVAPEEWLPFYVQPELAGLSDGQARGALQKAQTAAREAAYAAQPEEYKARALARIESLEQRPSTCVDSGGGYQCTWLLEETVHVTDASRAHVAHVQRAFVDFVGADHGAHDLRRVLRVPGSQNVKKRYAPHYPEVGYLWADFERLYTFDGLAALLPAEEPAPSPVQRQRRLYTPAGLEHLQMPAHVPPVPTCKEVDAYNASTPLPALLAQYGYTHAGPGRMHRPGGSTAGVELHAEDNSATIYSSADPLYLGRRIRPADVLLVFEHAGDVDALLEALGATDMASMPTALEALRLWARRVDFAALVPEELRPRGYLTPDRDQVIFLKSLDVYASQERTSLCAPLSARKLSELANVGLASAHRALQTLCTFALEPEEGAEAHGKAKRYRVRREVVAEALRLYRAHRSCSNGTRSTEHALHERRVPSEQLSHRPLDTHTSADAFAYVATPITPERLAEINDERAGVPLALARVAAINEKRQRSIDKARQAGQPLTPEEIAAINEKRAARAGKAWPALRDEQIEQINARRAERGRALLEAAMRRPPLSEAQVAEINAKRADGARPPLALTVQVRRRLAAKYPSLGKRGLRVIDALEALGGEAAKKELREELHVSAPSLARVLARLEEVGLVRLSHYGAALLLPWRERLEEITPAMPTYGTGARRAYRSACESAAYFEEAQAYAPPERLPYLRRRQAEEAAKRDAYEEAHELHERWRKERADYYADALEHAPPKEQPYLRRKLAEAEAQRDGLEEQAGLHERRRKERARERLQGLHQNARMALVQEAEAVQPALEQEVQRLRYAGTDKAEAQRMLQIAGYAPRAIRRAMQRYWPPLVSREPDLHKVFDSSNWSQKRYTSAARL